MQQVQTHSADFNGFPQSHPHAPVTSPPTIDVSDGTSDPITHPSASRPSGSSFAAGIGNIPIPMSGLTPALAPSSPLTWMSSMTPTPKSLMRTWMQAPPRWAPLPSPPAPPPLSCVQNRDRYPFPAVRAASVPIRWFTLMTPSSGSGQT